MIMGLLSGKDKDKDTCWIDGRKAVGTARTLIGTKVKICDAHGGKKDGKGKR